MKLWAKCKECGDAAQFAGFMRGPALCFFDCSSCGKRSEHEGSPNQFLVPVTVEKLQSHHQAKLAADPIETTSVPEIDCPNCGDRMRLTGVERNTQGRKMLRLTFECRLGHLATTTYPN